MVFETILIAFLKSNAGFRISDCIIILFISTHKIKKCFYQAKQNHRTIEWSKHLGSRQKINLHF
jgi:hypothetical protein